MSSWLAVVLNVIGYAGFIGIAALHNPPHEDDAHLA